MSFSSGIMPLQVVGAELCEEPSAVQAKQNSERQVDSIDQAVLADPAHARSATKQGITGEDLNSFQSAGTDTATSEAEHSAHADRSVEPVVLDDGTMERALGALVSTALEMEDPVAGLEQGLERLAEALAAGDIALEERQRAAANSKIEQQMAARYARFHRVGELLDTGYTLDHAIAIAKANEAEIRARATAIGRSPMEPIYQYALLNGFKPSAFSSSDSAAVERSSAAPTRRAAGKTREIEALAGLSDQAFAEATKDDRWQKLMQQ